MLDPYTGAEKADFWMDAGCNDLVGNLQEDGRVKEAYVASCNDVARELFYDAIVLLTQAEMTPRDDPMRYELLDTLSRCHRLLRRYTDEEFRQCLELTRHQLKKRGGDGRGYPDSLWSCTYRPGVAVAAAGNTPQGGKDFCDSLKSDGALS